MKYYEPSQKVREIKEAVLSRKAYTQKTNLNVLLELTHESKEFAYQIFNQAYQWCHRYQLPPAISQKLAQLYSLLDRPEPRPECRLNMICECNRRNCPGKVLAVTTYIRKLRSA